MKKYVVSSVNENPEYLFFAPIWCAFWKKLGYDPYILLVDKNISRELLHLISETTEKNNGIIKHLEHIDGYKTCNVSQVARLFVAAEPIFKDDDYIITDDIDKFVISKPWFNQQDFSKDIHIFDADETGYTRLKIGYIGMKTRVWKEIIGISDASLHDNLKQCLDANIIEKTAVDNYIYKSQREKELDQAWNLDESILTAGVFQSKYYPDQCQMITRGANQYGLRNGRIDRTAWKQTFIQYISTRIIDVHLHRKPYEEDFWQDVKMIMTRTFTPEEINYFEEYRSKFIELI